MFTTIKTYLKNLKEKLGALFTTKKSRKKLWMILAFILFIIVLISLYKLYVPGYIAKSLKRPELSQFPPNVTNQDMEFIAKDSIVVYYKDRPFWPAPNHKNEYNFGKKEGLSTFKVYSYSDIFGLGKIKSNEFIEITTTGDYTAPTFEALEIKKAYPKKEDSFSFVIKEKDLIIKNGDTVMFDPEKTDSKCKQEPVETNFKVICPIAFGEAKELKLSYTIQDKAGNITKITDNLAVKNVDLPTLTCTELPAITTKVSFDIICKTNKNGSLKDANGEVAKAEKDKDIVLKVNLKEGDNVFSYTFVDEDGFDVTKELRTTSDTKAPTLEFTYLDTKKEFNKGSFILKFKPSETADAKVNVRPYNETFENDPRFKEPLLAKTWGYSGGSNYVQTVLAGQEVVFTTPNNMGGCQIYDNPSPNQSLIKVPQGYCAFYNVFFVKTDISLTDKAGNSSQYQCTSYTWDQNKNPAGDLPTECKKV